MGRASGINEMLPKCRRILEHKSKTLEKQVERTNAVEEATVQNAYHQ